MRATVLLVMLSASSSATWAQGSNGRSGTWELGFDAFHSNAETLSGQGGSSLDVDSALGFGGVAAYNLTDHIAVLGEIDWSRPDYQARLDIDGTGAIQRIDATLDLFTVLLKGIFYFSPSDFSPYLEIGAGWTRVDSNVASGPPSTGCWWDPWWGYVCAQSFDTYHDTRTTYTSAFGVRWDITPEMLMKLSWGLLDVDTGSRTEQSSRDVFRVEFSWKL